MKLNYSVSRLNLLIVFITLFSCKSYKIIYEDIAEAQERTDYYAENAKWMSFFILFEPSLEGEKIQIDTDRKHVVTRELNNCHSTSIGLCASYEIENSASIYLKIGKEKFTIPSYTVYKYRCLVVYKIKKQIYLKYTNYPKLYY